MSSLFNTGIRPAIDEYLTKKGQERRDYGQYWGASSAGYCMRLNILRRLNIPKVPEIQEDAPRTQRVFECGHVFHEWAQRITKDAGLSVAQELELQDEDLMVRGHIDDLVLVSTTESAEIKPVISGGNDEGFRTIGTRPQELNILSIPVEQHLILYDYKTANSQSFNYKRDEIGHYHKMQLGTYMYMLRNNAQVFANAESKNILPTHDGTLIPVNLEGLNEGRILTISKDDLRMREHQLMWSLDLEAEINAYWGRLNGYWRSKTLPPCTCLDHDGGFMGKRSKKGKIYNDYFYQGEPCSLEWATKFEEVKGFLNKED
jgi:hypothetical protein